METTQIRTPLLSNFAHNRTRVATYGAFLAFFLFGFADNIKGPTFPAVLQDLHFTYAKGGTLLLGAYLGFLVATVLTGLLADFAGKKAVIFVACACLFLGMLWYSSGHDFWMLTGAMTILGLGLGSIEVGGNLIIVDLYQQDKGRYLNLLAFFHGLGSMLAPLYAGQLLEAGVSWRSIYQSGILLVLILFVYFLCVRYPRRQAATRQKLTLQRLGASVFTGQMMLCLLVIAFYVAAEIGIAAWLVEFLQKAKSQSVLKSSLYLSLFFGAITLGRFLGSFLVERFGYLPMMLLTSLASVVCLSAGIFGPPILAFCLPLTGLFFSIIFPTVTAVVSDLHQENVGTILGIFFTFAGLGGMIGPWLIGLVSNWGGILMGFNMILMCCVLMSGLFVVLVKNYHSRSRTFS